MPGDTSVQLPFERSHAYTFAGGGGGGSGGIGGVGGDGEDGGDGFGFGVGFGIGVGGDGGGGGVHWSSHSALLIAPDVPGGTTPQVKFAVLHAYTFAGVGGGVGAGGDGVGGVGPGGCGTTHADSHAALGKPFPTPASEHFPVVESHLYPLPGAGGGPGGAGARHCARHSACVPPDPADALWHWYEVWLHS